MLCLYITCEPPKSGKLDRVEGSVCMQLQIEKLKITIIRICLTGYKFEFFLGLLKVYIIFNFKIYEIN